MKKEKAVQYRSSKKCRKKASAKYVGSSQMVMRVSLGGKHTRVNTALLLGFVSSVNWVMEQVNA